VLGETIDRALERARAAGERIALARVLDGPWAGRRLLVWPGGQAMGDLGAPRLNQRVALHAEAMLERGERTTRKPFELRGSRVEVEVRTFGERRDA
jgi:xanthine/CO dehydrogenase XdhC/CoxF family maturation factor